MEQLDALIADVCARAGEVRRAEDPQKMMRELLAPLRDFFLQQSTADSKRYELPNGKIDDVAATSAADANAESESPAKHKVPTYLTEAATRIQALVLGNTRTTAARSDTSNSSNDGTKSVIEPVKSLNSSNSSSKPQNYFSGAASRFQAFVRGSASNSRESSAMVVLSPNPKDKTTQKLQLGAAATRIQALVRGKTERNSFIQQRSFLLQGTKVCWLYALCISKYCMVVLIVVCGLLGSQKIRAQERSLPELPRSRHASWRSWYVAVRFYI